MPTTLYESIYADGSYSDRLHLSEAKKLRLYKNRIIEEFLRFGSFPGKAKVEKALNSIDLRLAIFQPKAISSGELFDTEKFNKEFADIYSDLLILYKVAYELCKKEYDELNAYVETHLAELERMATRFEQMALLESGTTALGTTVFFQSSGYDATIDGTTVTIDLGLVQVHAGTRLACILESTEIVPQYAVFSFDGNNCSSYSYNHDLFQVPGEPSLTTYSYSLSDSMTIQRLTPILEGDENFDADASSYYYIYAGEKHVLAEDGTTSTSVEISSLTQSVSVDEDGRLSFYILDGTYVEFNFSKQPSSKNFSGVRIDKPDKIQYIEMEYEDGISFSLATDGAVYAEKQAGIVSGGVLYYPNNIGHTDFRIYAYSEGSLISYETKLVLSRIYNGMIPSISCIAIKEIPAKS